jgi:hypothetical protein
MFLEEDRRKLKNVSAGLGMCELLSEIRTFRPGAFATEIVQDD